MGERRQNCPNGRERLREGGVDGPRLFRSRRERLSAGAFFRFELPCETAVCSVLSLRAAPSLLPGLFRRRPETDKNVCTGTQSDKNVSRLLSNLRSSDRRRRVASVKAGLVNSGCPDAGVPKLIVRP